MVPDGETDFVCFSDLLSQRYPALAGRLAAVLEGHGIASNLVRGTRDIWCRDYMPIQIDTRRFVQFRYAPDYLTGGYEHLITPPEVAAPFTRGSSCRQSSIVLDGGNVVRWRAAAILTDKVYRENPGYDRQTLRGELASGLEVDRLVLIPKEPYDKLGHADGIVRFLDGRTVVVNDYSAVNPAYRQGLLSCLRRAGLEAVELPFAPAGHSGPGLAPATGCYVNFLQTQRVLLVPTYGIPADERALRLLEGLFRGVTVVPVNCSDLAREGGALNCVSWSIRSSSDAQGIT